MNIVSIIICTIRVSFSKINIVKVLKALLPLIILHDLNTWVQNITTIQESIEFVRFPLSEPKFNNNLSISLTWIVLGCLTKWPVSLKEWSSVSASVVVVAVAEVKVHMKIISALKDRKRFAAICFKDSVDITIKLDDSKSRFISSIIFGAKTLLVVAAFVQPKWNCFWLNTSRKSSFSQSNDENNCVA